MPLLINCLAQSNIRTIITMHDCWYYTGGCFHYSQVNCFKWQQGCGNCPKKKSDTPAYFLDKSRLILNDRKRFFDSIPNLTITGVSKWICEESKKGIFKGKNVVTIHNGIDTTIFRPTTVRDFRPAEALLRLQDSLTGCFTIIGPATKWLNPINREAFEYVLRKMLSSDRFLLFGCDSESLTAFHSLDIPNELCKKVVFYGYTTERRQMAFLYSLSHVFVNCTREDSFSLINVEAQACGTPIVTYANTGAQETVDNICSFSVPTCNVKAMWEKIMLIRKQGKSHYSADCIRWVNNNFNMRRNYLEYLDLYTNTNDK